MIGRYWPRYRQALPPAMQLLQLTQPGVRRGDITTTMLLGQAVAETTGLYGLAVAFILMFVKPSAKELSRPGQG